MNTWKVEGDRLVESEHPAAVLSHQFRTGYRVRTMPPSEWTTHEVYVQRARRVCRGVRGARPTEPGGVVSGGIVAMAALAAGLISLGLTLVLGWVALPICLGVGLLIGIIAGRA